MGSEVRRESSRSVALDALRGAAALFVLASHAYQLSGHSLPRGSYHANALVMHGLSMWVEVFFALSGFLVAGPWLKALVEGTALPSWRGYAIKRVGRILPAYWIALAVMLMIRPQHLHWWQYPVHGLLVQNLVPGQFQTVMFVAWTLSLEMIFYIVMPAAVAGLRRLHPARWSTDSLAGVIVGCWLATQAMNPIIDRFASGGGTTSPWAIAASLTHGLPAFALGMVVFLAERDRAGRRSRVWRAYEWLLVRPARAIAVAIGLALVARLLFSASNPVLAQRNGVPAAIAAALVLAVVARRQPNGACTRVLGMVGTVSYGIYLWHWVLRVTLPKLQLVPMQHGGALAYVVHLVGLLLGALTAATVSWIVVERPLLRVCHRWARRAGLRPGRAVPSPVPALAT